MFEHGCDTRFEVDGGKRIHLLITLSVPAAGTPTTPFCPWIDSVVSLFVLAFRVSASSITRQRMTRGCESYLYHTSVLRAVSNFLENAICNIVVSLRCFPCYMGKKGSSTRITLRDKWRSFLLLYVL